MALERTDTLGIGDWALCVSLDVGNVAKSRHVPLPFNGYVERVTFMAGGDVGATPVVLTLNLNGGSTLATMANLGPTTTQGEIEELSYNAMDSPIQFAENDDLVLVSDGGGAAAVLVTVMLVLRRQ